MRLEELVSPRFSIEARGRRADLRMLLMRARELASRIEPLGEPGSVIAVPADDPIELLALFEAVWSQGRAALPLLNATAPCATDLPKTSAALVIRTSGSTGALKFPAFAGGAVLKSAATIAGYLGLTDADRIALMQPLEHGFGLVGQLFSAAWAGATAIWAGSPFADERAENIVAAKATVVAAVPFLLAQLLDFAIERAPLRSVGSAGGPLPGRLAKALMAALPGATVWNQYGCTEAGPRLSACPSTSAAFARGSVGKAIAGVALSVTPDEGHIVFESPMAMLGYLGDPEATAAARIGRGFKTGDLGRLDDQGNLYVTGRSDEIVKVRGHKVSLRAVAEALEAAGADAAVALLVPGDSPRADLEASGVLCAVFVGACDIPLAALSERLPLECLPARMFRVRTLPRLRSGKIDRLAVASFLCTAVQKNTLTSCPSRSTPWRAKEC